MMDSNTTSDVSLNATDIGNNSGDEQHDGITTAAISTQLNHQRRRRVSLYKSLPITVWSEIIEHLSLMEGRQFYQTCRSFWKLSSTFESHRRKVDIVTNTNINGTNQRQDHLFYLVYPPICYNLKNLTVLNLSTFAADQILFNLQNLLPNLQEIYMIGSGNDGFTDLSDRGLLSLMLKEEPDHIIASLLSTNQAHAVSFDAARCRNLRYIDITGCSNTSYFVTIMLRQHLQHPDLIIRRIPKWMEGHYDTMYPNDGIHTYYADGSFLYDRSSSNCGYVCDLWKWPAQEGDPVSSDSNTTNQVQRSLSEDDYATYGDYLRIINPDIPFPESLLSLWSDLVYPGVTLSRYRDDETDDSAGSNGIPIARTTNNDEFSVVVVQSGNRLVLSPESYRYPIFRDAPNSVLQCGQSMFRDADGNILTTNTENSLFRVTRMQKYPLTDIRYNEIRSKTNITDPQFQQTSHQRNSSMPPDHIVAAIRDAEKSRMSTNLSELIQDINPYWNNDDDLVRRIDDVNQLFFQRPCIVDPDDRFCRMIHRQKIMHP